MSNICFNLNNRIDISNNYYIFNNVNGVIGDYNFDNGTGNRLIQSTYGLYETSANKIYSIQNIPKTHPIGFFDASNLSPIVDISNLIKYDVSYGESIKIYVSKGSDLSFSNDNYYRFYDESYNLINIDTNYLNSDIIINSSDNFYFMSKQKYKFIAGKEYSTDSIFKIEYNGITESLDNLDSSFIFIIDENANNSTHKISYYDKDNKEKKICNFPDCEL